MELQIQNLVASIKSEGIDNAKKEAAKIINEAQKKADKIVEQAKEEAKKVYEDNQKEIEILKQSAVVSAQQAKRDAIISFRQEINDQYSRLLVKDVAQSLSDENLAKLISCVVSDGDLTKLSVEVNSVSEALKAQLSKEIKEGLIIRPVKTIKAGFRVVMKDGSGFIDCTDEEIAKMLSPFLGE